MLVDASAIAANVAHVQERIAQAAKRSRRPPGDITLVAVSKTFPADAIQSAYETGLRHFGENRVQEWESKRAAVAGLDATWHLIGHLQRNKAVRAVEEFDTIDSVDSVELAQKLNVAARARGGSPLPVLIEVRVSEENTKTGAQESDVLNLAQAILSMDSLELRGLMAIPPFFDDPEQARPYFRHLRELRDTLRGQMAAATASRKSDRVLTELSMGMSHDFEIAIEEGATQVRVGTAIFGLRPAK